MEHFLSREEAREIYELRIEKDPASLTDLEAQLVTQSVAEIEMPIASSEFEAFMSELEACITDCPDDLATTYMKIDSRHGNEAGHVRKEAKFNQETGLQIQDPKHIFHFTESNRLHWDRQFNGGPRILQEFLAHGYELHDQLIEVSRLAILETTNTHPNGERAYFPDGVEAENNQTLSFMRIVSYDEYADDKIDNSVAVAKTHYDIGGWTTQAYANADGFYGLNALGEKTYYPTPEGIGHFFAGMGHNKLYDGHSPIKALKHGVDRVPFSGGKRFAVILFHDAPDVDLGITPKDTLPHLHAN